MERDTTEYRLAERVAQLERALEKANELLNNKNSLGVNPDNSVRFRESQKFHKRVREIIKENE